MDERADDDLKFSLTLFTRIIDATRPQNVSFLGGEPMLWHYLKEAICFCRQRNIHTYVVSNLTLLTKEMAHFLYEYGVHVIGKLNIGNIDDKEQLRIQSELIGSSLDYVHSMLNGLFILLDIGYTSPKLDVANLIRRPNIQYVASFLEFCKNNHINPFLEIPCNSDDLSLEEIASIVYQVQRYFDGIILPPHFTSPCNHFDNSLYFRANGDIQACSGNKTILANYEKEQDAIERALNHPIIKTRKEITKQIEGPCKQCHLLNKCKGGCRAYAEQTSLTQSYQQCWRISHDYIPDIADHL
jgi:radical SAM protein with 4Fe4S-binding SPASM domain